MRRALLALLVALGVASLAPAAPASAEPWPYEPFCVDIVTGVGPWITVCTPG